MAVDYDAVCKQAITDQGLDSVIAELGAEFPNVFADQTGGFVFVVKVTAADGSYVGITEVGHDFPAFYLVGYVNDGSPSFDCEGFDIADGVVLEHVADYVRGFVNADGGTPSATNVAHVTVSLVVSVTEGTEVVSFVQDQLADGLRVERDAVTIDTVVGQGQKVVTTAQLRDLLATWTDRYDTVYDAVQALIDTAENGTNVVAVALLLSLPHGETFDPAEIIASIDNIADVLDWSVHPDPDVLFPPENHSPIT